MALPVLQFIDRELLARAQLLARMGVALGEILPPILHGHFWVTGIIQDELRLTTDSPHFVPALHFNQAALLERANTLASAGHFGPVRRLRISLTNSNVPSAPRVPTHKAPIASQTVSQLTTASAALGDSELREALLILARRLGGLAARDSTR